VVIISGTEKVTTCWESLENREMLGICQDIDQMSGKYPAKILSWKLFIVELKWSYAGVCSFIRALM